MIEAQASAKSPKPADASGAKPPQPTEFPPAVKKTIGWLSTAFAHWYHLHPVPLPHRYAKREYGFMQWPERPGPPPFFRHKAFPTAEGLRDYLARAGPHSAYYSTAYYNRPAELKMADKQWLGAELIFDLDADHLAEAEAAKAAGHEMPLDEQLRLVKTQFKRLLDEFLFGDFGLGEDDVWITFSGGRGYHAHVVEERLLQLESRGRREIVDYITGKFPAERGKETPDLSWLITERVVHPEGRGKFVKKTTQETMARADAPGWPGRITRTLAATLRERVLEAPDRRSAKAWLTSLEGIGAGGADKFLDRFDARALERVEAGYVDQGPVVRRVIHNVLAQATLPFAKGETDEPVTADTKRLIRLPGSLHGKSGLRVVTLTRSQLDDFEPLRDAVAFGSDPVRINPRKDAEATLGGERIAVKAGVETEVPEHHAVFWLARQGGTIVLPDAANR
mgnify:CR=1 FL=1